MLVAVLGGISLITTDGTTLPIAGSRQPALLAALAARVGQVVSADQLVELLWGEDLPEKPSAALYSVVFKLRANLARASGGRELLITRDSGYLFDLDADDLDAATFTRLVDRARSEPPERAEATLAEALGLWHGRAFGEFADTELAHLEAMRLEELRLASTEARGQALLDAGRPADVVSLMRPFIAEHPLREAARILLMQALHGQGRTSEALEEFHHHRAYLADELGLEPSEAMVRVQSDLLRTPEPVSESQTQGSDPTSNPPSEESRAETTPQGLTGLHVRYLKTPAGHTIAYGTTGTGPRLLVILGWVSSLDVVASGRDPRSSLYQRLAGDLSMTLFDRVGTGLSAGEVDDYGLQSSVDELAAVVEAIGPPVALMAMSAAGPIALKLAHEHPEWVDSLVLFGTFANGPATFRDEQLTRMMTEIVRTYWGMGSKMLADLYRPGISDEAAWHLAKVFRDSADPDVAASYLEATYGYDVSELLPEIQTPALVLHYRSDRLIWFRGGQDLAAGLPNAVFVPLDGRFHLPDAADLDAIEEAIVGHVARHSSQQPISRQEL